MSRELWYRATENFSIALLFEPRDLWIGLYWDRIEWVWGTNTTIYIGIIPMFPIRVSWENPRAV